MKLLLVILISSYVFADFDQPNNLQLTFRHHYQYSKFGFPIKKHDLPLLDELDSNIDKRRELSWKLFEWMTESKNEIPRMFHWLSTQELKYSLAKVDNKNVYENINLLSKDYPKSLFWNHRFKIIVFQTISALIINI